MSAMRVLPLSRAGVRAYAVPRHTEISDVLTRKISRGLSVPR
jgi:hypothetical protein